MEYWLALRRRVYVQRKEGEKAQAHARGGGGCRPGLGTIGRTDRGRAKAKRCCCILLVLYIYTQAATLTLIGHSSDSHVHLALGLAPGSANVKVHYRKSLSK